MAIALIAYWPTSLGLWDYWLQPYVGGQGVLVAALALWLLLRAGPRLTRAPLRPLPWAALLIVPLGLAWLIFWRAGIQALHFLLLPLLILAALLAAFGTAVTRALAVPVAYLYFAMPAWDVLTPLLQRLTLAVVGLVAPLLGLPAHLQGSTVSFPNGAQFEVTPPCAGVAILVQGLAVATLLGELEGAPLARRLRLLGAMIVVALLANWARVLIIIDAGYATGMRHVIVTHHLLFGWMFFVAVLVLFVWVATRRPLPAAVPGAAAGEVRPAGRVARAYIAALLALVLVPLAVYCAAPRGAAAPEERGVSWPVGRAGWRGPVAVSADAWQPQFLGPHFESRAAYRDDAGREVEALAIDYARQAPAHKLVGEGNSLFGARLSLLSLGVAESDGRRYAEAIVADDAGGQSVIWSVYDIAGRRFLSPVLSQLWYGVRTLSTEPHATLLAWRAQCVPSCATARETLTSFARAVGESLSAQGSRAEVAL